MSLCERILAGESSNIDDTMNEIEFKSPGLIESLRDEIYEEISLSVLAQENYSFEESWVIEELENWNSFYVNPCNHFGRDSPVPDSLKPLFDVYSEAGVPTEIEIDGNKYSPPELINQIKNNKAFGKKIIQKIKENSEKDVTKFMEKFNKDIAQDIVYINNMKYPVDSLIHYNNGCITQEMPLHVALNKEYRPQVEAIQNSIHKGILKLYAPVEKTRG